MPARATHTILNPAPVSGKEGERPNSAETAHPAVDVIRQRGWQVFPISPTSKKALYSGRQTNGNRWGHSNDPEYVARLFAEKRSRDAHVGVACGPPSGIFVIDIDTVKGHGEGRDGHASLAALLARYGPLPVTLTALTPSGGEHFYFCYPCDGRKVVSRALRDENDVQVDGIDVKGHGGYVVTVPSKGRIWRDPSAPIAGAPSWLLDLVCERPRKATKVRATRRVPVNSSEVQERWSWRSPVAEPQRAAVAPPEIIAMMREDAGLGLSLDIEDYTIDRVAECRQHSP